LFLKMLKSTITKAYAANLGFDDEKYLFTRSISTKCRRFFLDIYYMDPEGEKSATSRKAPV